MPIHFERFRFLNGTGKHVENVSYQGHIFVKVDDHPEIEVPPGESRPIPDGEVIEVSAPREL